MKRVQLQQCGGVVVDLQEYFLASLKGEARKRLESRFAEFFKLLSFLKIPVLATLERPLAIKGQMPSALSELLKANTGFKSLEKEFFDLTKHKGIVVQLASLKRKQVLLTGCETDVCVLQSCLGLLSLGYEVFVIEDLVFSATEKCDVAIGRMRDAGAVLVSYKTLYHELVEAISASPHGEKLAGVPEYTAF